MRRAYVQTRGHSVVVKFQVDPDQEFQKAVLKARGEVGDLTIPFTLIAKSWFQSNSFIFKVTGSSGKYVDLSAKYKAWKLRTAKFIYPVLRLSGDLEKSITDATDKNAISIIINKRSLFLGTKVPYAGWLQEGTKNKDGSVKMPARPPVLIGAESVAPSGLNTRRDLWIKTIADYVVKKTAQNVGKENK